MSKFLHILGVRPHCVKFTPIGKDVVVWTGQHYSKEMKDDLIKEFGIKIEYDLPCSKLWEMISEIDIVIKKEKPDCVVVYGDTRSSLAGTLAANEAGVKIAHIEAGVRSKLYNRYEEKARRSIDAFSSYLFCPDQQSMDNLDNEKIMGEKFLVGDVHYEEYVKTREHKGYLFVTIHRQEHVDSKQSLLKMVKEFRQYKGRIIFSAHPRTQKNLKAFNVKLPDNVDMRGALSHKDTLDLVKSAMVVLTDSGGLVKEAVYCGTPVMPFGIDEWEPLVPISNAKKKIRSILSAR